MTDKFPNEVESLVTNLQGAYCEEYFKNPVKERNKQIQVINFIIATTVKAHSVKRGATKISVNDELLRTYFEKIIVPELDSEKANSSPILTSQAIKFLVIYRNFIPKDWMIDILQKLMTFLTNESLVVRTYSSSAIEKLLAMRDLDTKKLIFTQEAIKPLLEDLLKQLNILISESEGLHNYALMSLFRVVSIAKEDFAPFAEGFSDAMINFINKAFKDSYTSAYSIYILFETLGYVIDTIPT